MLKRCSRFVARRPLSIGPSLSNAFGGGVRCLSGHSRDGPDAQLRVSLVGRPNVGKSTLLNRLAGRRRAIAHSLPGLTRDERSFPASLGDIDLVVWDTPGVLAAEAERSRSRASAAGSQVRRNNSSKGDDNDDGGEGSDRIGSSLGFVNADRTLAAQGARLRFDTDRDLTRVAMLEAMTAATARAVRRSHVSLFVIDARDGVTREDVAIARWLRGVSADKPLLLVANKSESLLQLGADPSAGDTDEKGAKNTGGADADFEHQDRDASSDLLKAARSLGLGEPVAISALHGVGLQDLYVALKPLEIAVRLSVGLPAADEASFARGMDRVRMEKRRAKEMEIEDNERQGITGDETDAENEGGRMGRTTARVALIGRPNAGKSTLLNRLVGEERVVVGPEPGVTRDAVPVDFEHGGATVTLVDTAGVERVRVATRRTDSDPVVRESRRDTLRAVVASDVAVVVIDHARMSKGEDLQQIHRVVEEGRGVVVAINKWDLVRDREERRSLMRQVSEMIKGTLPQLGDVEHVHISAANGKGVSAIMPAVLRVRERLHARVQTRKLNRWLSDVVRVHQPPRVNGVRLKIRFITQATTRPPTFVLFLNARKEQLPGSYVQYLVGAMRREFDLHSVPIRIVQRNQPMEGGKGAGKRARRTTSIS